MEKTIAKDIYSKEGLLLLSKGSKIVINNNNRDKLDRLGILKEVLANTEKSLNKIEIKSIEKSLDIKNIAKSFTLYNSICEDKSFIKICDMINDILHNHKTEIWYTHLNALTNYVSWIYSHSVNTTLLSGILALKMGYDHDKIYKLILGTMLHDIGMILIPKKILLKPDRLDDTEFVLVQKHCELGYAIIAGSEINEMVKNIILQHHERMDGSGYPLKLTDKEITEEAKIVMIADSFDTATSYRPYKIPKDASIVIDEMLEERDKYDYDIVNILKTYLFN